MQSFSCPCSKEKKNQSPPRTLINGLHLVSVSRTCVGLLRIVASSAAHMLPYGQQSAESWSGSFTSVPAEAPLHP